ncbi:MAG: BREX-1 system adenine-specific DNA-methyltransferase PglX [Candidatus Thiodiazotropha lotti]|nr:BREX-1 system adenine-specific DNA-methyltransferase PglX [Candidatus Thiodiazotropha lotti]
METAKLKKFAQFARRSLIEQVSTKLKLVLAVDSAARRESAEAVKKLEEQIKANDKEQVIEKVAYIWFNRFCALRFMDVNRYSRIGVVSPAEGQFQPEILAEAKMGHIDEDMVQDQARQQIFALLDGKAPSSDPQGEAYRLLVVAVCNFWNKAMPYLFQRIEDYTELLMPEDLLSGNSILANTREAMTPDTCEDVEVIGWLYQFYISEKKDEVFDGLKKNKKITPENIPAATQLFTPHWIVRYLVENSLGRLWMLNRPGSKLVEQMDYYIRPEEDLTTKNTNDTKKEHEETFRDFRAFRGSEKDFLVVNSPEEIKICDPACGSGHMLTYAFELLYAIYEEEGYEPAEIPEKILTHNLYGIEIDERAGELAAFALTMKARAKQRRFFSKGVKPNICVLENVHFDEGELKDYMDFVGRDLFTAPLQTTLRQFEEADNFGSLIRPDVTDVDDMLKVLESKDVSGQLFLSSTHQKVLQALRQADYLSPKYHVVIANPPYMGTKGMNERLGNYIKDLYPDAKSDLFSAFVVRCAELGQKLSHTGIMSPNVWMSLSSHEKFRNFITNKKTLTNVVELPLTGFKGATVQICAYTFENKYAPDQTANFIRLVEFKGGDEEMAARAREAVSDPSVHWLYRASASDFYVIPGQPIAYWAGKLLRESFRNGESVGEVAKPRQGMATTNNELFLRTWSEVSHSRIKFDAISESDAEKSNAKWFPYNKGGPYRKWYGNFVHVVNFENCGRTICDYIDNTPGARVGSNGRVINREFYFKPGVTWSDIKSGGFGARLSPGGFVFDVKGSSGFPDEEHRKKVLGLLSSNLTTQYMEVLNPTVTFQVGDISRIPYKKAKVDHVIDKLVGISSDDWNSYEASWDFTYLPLLNSAYRQPTLRAAYQKLRSHWLEMTLEMQRLEQENNRIFIEAYGLQDELTSEVPLNGITLTCNPHYRYGNDKSEGELEALLLADTIRELVSYAVGCMFGRYALDKPGLILANQGETIDDYLKHIHESSFLADDDNVIPMLDGDWFTDDIAERFRKFLRVTFGEVHYEENLRFVEQALNIKGKRNYGIRDYFLGEFYTDHVKRYKKRPIYWLFSSPKGSFNALIYMHRYRPDTVSVVLNDYLREFRTKLTARKNHLDAVSVSASATQGEKTKALKEIDKLIRMIQEMEEYERDVLYPLATEQVEIDLDDGVKVNYNKFDAALKKIAGLSGAYL